MIYQFIDENMKHDINELSVSFTFNSDTTAEEATEQIDKLVKLADNDSTITFIEHEHDIYRISPYSEVSVTPL